MAGDDPGDPGARAGSETERGSGMDIERSTCPGSVLASLASTSSAHFFKRKRSLDTERRHERRCADGVI